MKRIIVFMFLASFLVIISAQSPVYTVIGKIEGADGIQFLLQKPEGGKMTDLNNATVKEGTFIMKGGSVEYPESVYLVSADKKSMMSFFLENSEITITGNLASLRSAKVKGSKTQDEIYSLTDSMQPFILKYSLKNSELQAAKKSGNEAQAAQLSKEIKELMNEAITIQKEFIVSHPSSFAVPMILKSIASSLSASELESIINSLDPVVAKTPVIVSLASGIEVLKRVEIGQKAPDFTQNDRNGNPVALSSLTGKKLLLIDFWAAWCSPCRAENPNVVKVYNEFKDKGFDILGVSLDRTAQDWNKAITDDKLTWTHVSDLQYWNNAAAKLYGVSSIPANFLLDKNGIIIAKNLRGEDLYNKIKALLGNN